MIYIYNDVYIYNDIYIYNDKYIYIWIYTIIVDIIWMKHQKYTFNVHTFDDKCLWMSVDCLALGPLALPCITFEGVRIGSSILEIMPVNGYTQ